MIQLAIAGAAGRMGRTLIEAAHENPQTQVVHGFEQPGSSNIDRDSGELAGIGNNGVSITDHIGSTDFDTLVEFTSPAATVEHIEYCRVNHRQIVIGTTGFSKQDQEKIEQAAQDIAIVLAPNMSVGVNLCLKLLEVAAEVLGDTVDIEVVEAHHRNKVDAPSGTALRMGEVIAAALNRTLADTGVFSRHGQTGVRGDKDIGFATIRAGDIVGEHNVMFVGSGERIEISHKATSRMVFAHGALRAAVWLSQQKPGLYNMENVLGLD